MVHKYIDSLNRVNVAHQCDKRRDRQPIEIARPNSSRCALK